MWEVVCWPVSCCWRDVMLTMLIIYALALFQSFRSITALVSQLFSFEITTLPFVRMFSINLYYFEQYFLWNSYFMNAYLFTKLTEWKLFAIFLCLNVRVCSSKYRYILNVDFSKSWWFSGPKYNIFTQQHHNLHFIMTRSQKQRSCRAAPQTKAGKIQAWDTLWWPECQT